ncbi:T9SS type A sorting domain-containing protein [Panacibacter ginsenosidivorans]|uniref:T9SS type A sorting domain-containing protein n=1 Tax=Panacibacter ginsenosidivorans TaxID=1813871 RepID=A0A5B8VCL9_9BACT|nr:FG-GAP-like repeat-containing protein [Panacibacter ginsenosidivorans]QEC69220.1 T9SS type A sorting domain-containing protein [Panacibacter ginsenosidivorans]
MKKKILLMAMMLLTIFSVTSMAQGIWKQKADFGNTTRQWAVGFSIGNKGYLGTGLDNNLNDTKDLWEYDPAINAWTQKADFGGAARSFAVGFSVGNEGYLGTGLDYESVKPYKDFWEYDPMSNTWTQKADFGGTARSQAVGLSIGNKGYIGTGNDGSYPYIKQDFWEYDPGSNTWNQRADFVGGARNSAIGFSIGSKGYLGTGYDYASNNYYKDLWEYDPVSNIWTQKADFGGPARSYAVGLRIGNKGYIGTGVNFPNYYKDFWEYDPAANTWMQKADFQGGARDNAVGFSISKAGYLGTGNLNGTYYKDFWEYTPDNNIMAIPTITSFSPTSGPVGTTVTITGTNFTLNPDDNTVYFGATKATVTAATSTSLNVSVPVGAIYEPITVTTNGLTAYSAKPFIVTFEGGGGPFTTNSFAPKVEFASLGYSRGIATGDLDGDGKADMVTSSELGGISIFRNTGDIGNFSFAERIDIYIPDENNYYDLAIRDLDGDGKLDIAVLNAYSVDLFRNTSTQGSISFEPKIRLAGGGFGKISIGDLDSDGKPDIVAVNNSNYPDWNHIIVFKNKSTIGEFLFDQGMDIPTIDYPFGIATGDLDGDGKPELTVSNNGFYQTSGTSISVFRNISSDGQISFETPVQYTTETHPEDVAVGDLDGDDKLDVAVCNYSSHSVSIFKNISQPGTILLSDKVDYYSTESTNVSVGDLNGDGKPDLATVGGFDVTVYRNTCTPGLISFDEGIAYPTGYGAFGGVAISDLDSDGKADLAIAHYYGTPLAILRNLLPITVCLPPTDLKVTNVADTCVRLSWTPPSSSVLCFQVAYSSVRSGTWIKKWRPSSTDHIVLKDLQPNTTYKWAVRSICDKDSSTSEWIKGPNFTTSSSFASATLSISPNPVTGNMLTVRFTNINATNIQLTISDLQGRGFINQKLLLNVGILQKTIDVSTLPKGIYVLKIADNKNEQQQIKFVKAN